ncbi:MAG: hypothetical protein KatS3mg102_2747 [Planctomycetota bacterium]|nr:MAG: hypothetical protein KatS3mg102_2747 [Planctomycetota bacterium]
MRATGWGLLGATALLLALACNDLDVPPFDRSRAARSAAAEIVPRPEVELLQPLAGSFLAPGSALVVGRVSPAVPAGATVVAVEVGGQPVGLAADGTFQTFVVLEPGINVIRARALDAQGRAGTRAIAVMAGEYNPPGQHVPAALGARFNDLALDAFGSILERVIWSLDLGQLTAAPIDGGAVLWGRLWTAIRAVRFADVVVRLDARPDGLHVEAAVERPEVDLQAWVDAGLGIVIGPERATARADRITVRARVIVGAWPDDRLRLQIEDVQLDFVRFRIDAASGLVQLVAQILASTIRREIEDFALRAIRDAQPQIDAALADSLNPQVPFDVFGKPLWIDVRTDLVSFDAGGFGLVMRFDAPPLGWSAQGLAAPGSLRTPGGLPPLQTARGLMVTVDDDAINRVLHAAWAGGVLDVDLTTQALAQLGISVPGGGLVAFDLRQFLPEIGGAVPDLAPLAARVRAGLPPVVRVGPGPDVVQVQLGEVAVEVLVERGAGWETLCEVAVHARVGATAELDSRGVWLRSARHPELVFDLRRAPIVPLDARRLQVVLGMALTPLVPRLINQVPVLPVPHIGQLRTVGATIAAGGPAGERLRIEADLVR